MLVDRKKITPYYDLIKQLGFDYTKTRKQSEYSDSWKKHSTSEIENNYKIPQFYYTGELPQNSNMSQKAIKAYLKQTSFKIDLHYIFHRHLIKKNKTYAISGYKFSNILAFQADSTKQLLDVLSFFNNPIPIFLEHCENTLYNCYLKFNSNIPKYAILQIESQFNVICRKPDSSFILPLSKSFESIQLINGEVIPYDYSEFTGYTTLHLYNHFEQNNKEKVPLFINDYTLNGEKFTTKKTDYFISNQKYFDAFQQEYGFDIDALVTLFYNSPEYTASMKKYLGCKGKNEATTKKLLIEIFGRFIYEYYTNFQRHISPEVRLTTEKRSEWETGTNLNFDLLNQYGEYSNYTRIKNAIFNFLEKAGVILEYGKHSSLPNLSIKKRYLLKIIDKNNFYFNIYKLLESLFNQLLLIFKNNNLFDRTKHLLKILLCETFSEGNNGEIDTKCFVGTG